MAADEWRVQHESDFIPFCWLGGTVEEFMADKEYYIVTRNYERESGRLFSAEAVFWRDGKLKFVQMVKP